MENVDPYADIMAIISRDREMRERLPARIPGYPSPMVPFTIEERDAMVDAFTAAEMARARRPIVIETGERDLDAEIAAVSPEELSQRPSVELEGYAGPMILLTERERWRLVNIVQKLGSRVRELGDRRSLSELILKDEAPDQRMAATFTRVIFDTIGIRAAADVIQAVIGNMEETNSPIHHANANVLREALDRFTAPPRPGAAPN